MFKPLQRFKSQFLDIEPITKKLSISHFLLMFGYKLFSLYFPLFLAWRGLSFVQIGYTYLLIYLSLAAFSPVSGMLCSWFSAALLITLGISGYFLYSLGMILNLNILVFYLFQIILGISASLFLLAPELCLLLLAKSQTNLSLGFIQRQFMLKF